MLTKDDAETFAVDDEVFGFVCDECFGFCGLLV